MTDRPAAGARGDARPASRVADPAAGGERVGPATAHAVKTSRTTNVHLSAEQVDVYISGHTGTAWFGADGEQTAVVTLVEPAV